jgi:multidrug efflux pump subunit AcrA (membrane-fusion protein)
MMRRTLWFAAGMTGLTLIGALVVGGAAYWAYANQLPPYIPRSVALPVPNAYDDYVLAAAMSRAVGGSGTTFRDRDRQVPPARLSAVVKRNWAALARLRRPAGGLVPPDVPGACRVPRSRPGAGGRG